MKGSVVATPQELFASELKAANRYAAEAQQDGQQGGERRLVKRETHGVAHNGPVPTRQAFAGPLRKGKRQHPPSG